MHKGTQSRLIYVLKFLWQSTDDEHLTTRTEIVQYLSSVGIQANNKTVGNDIDDLIEMGFDIAMGLQADTSEDKSLDIQIRIAELDAEFKRLLNDTNDENKDDPMTESKLEEIILEKSRLQQQLQQYENAKQKRENVKSRLDEIYEIIDSLKNHPLTYDDQIVRQIIECIVVESKEKIKIVFIGGMEVEQAL